MYVTQSHRRADCRYCQRYNYACGRHAVQVPLPFSTEDTPLPTL